MGAAMPFGVPGWDAGDGCDARGSKGSEDGGGSRCLLVRPLGAPMDCGAAALAQRRRAAAAEGVRFVRKLYPCSVNPDTADTRFYLVYS